MKRDNTRQTKVKQLTDLLTGRKTVEDIRREAVVNITGVLVMDTGPDGKEDRVYLYYGTGGSKDFGPEGITMEEFEREYYPERVTHRVILEDYSTDKNESDAV